MKYFFFLLLITTSATAQKQYGDFIQKDDSIQWAAEYTQILNLTPKLAKYCIREQAFKKANEKSCIENYKIVNENFVKSEFCLADTASKTITINSNINPYKILYHLQGEYLENFYKKESTNSFLNNAFKSKFQIDEVNQILYYKNANLYISNVLVSPLYLEKVTDTNSTTLFNWKKYYSICNNIEPAKKITKEEKAKLIDLGKSWEHYFLKNDLTENSYDFKVFTKINAGFSHHLFEDIFKNKITAVDDKNNIIPGSKILNVNNPFIEFPVFDGGDGRVFAPRKIRNEVNIDSFYNFRICQQVYLDTATNLLLSEVKYVDVYRKIVTPQGLDLGDGFFYRIYFIKPSLYKKPNTKGYLND